MSRADRLCIRGAELERLDALLVRLRAVSPPDVAYDRAYVLGWVLVRGIDDAAAWLTSTEAACATVASGIVRVVCAVECDYFPASCDLDKGHGGRHSTDGHQWNEERTVAAAVAT